MIRSTHIAICSSVLTVSEYSSLQLSVFWVTC